VSVRCALVSARRRVGWLMRSAAGSVGYKAQLESERAARVEMERKEWQAAIDAKSKIEAARAAQFAQAQSNMVRRCFGGRQWPPCDGGSRSQRTEAAKFAGELIAQLTESAIAQLDAEHFFFDPLVREVILPRRARALHAQLGVTHFHPPLQCESVLPWLYNRVLDNLNARAAMTRTVDGAKVLVSPLDDASRANAPAELILSAVRRTESASAQAIAARRERDEAERKRVWRRLREG
jgi:hypothetical protein